MQVVMKRNGFFLSIAMISLLLSPSLSSCSTENFVMIYSGAEEERNTYLYQQLYDRFPEYEIIIQSVGSSMIYTKLANEGTYSDCDIFYDVDITNGAQLSSIEPSILCDLGPYSENIPDYADSVNNITTIEDGFIVDCKTNLGIVINTSVLDQHNVPIPKSFQDLLNPIYNNLIQMPNPKSSGTGYGFYNGMVSLLGKEAALDYFRQLRPNINEFTSSGSAPLKALERGEIGIAIGMVWQGIQYSNENPDIQTIIPEEGSPYNLFVMGMVEGHQEREAVPSVFEYLADELNYEQTIRFTSDVIYAEQAPSLTPNYPTNVSEIRMIGLKDPEYKKDLLDSWEY